MIGRPLHTKAEYESWLVDMKPFLKRGMSLYRSLEKAGLRVHKDSIYRKFRLNDWFCEKITYYQGYLGELVNETLSLQIIAIHDKVISKNEPLTSVECSMLKLMATKHRSCQKFFITRKETVKADDSNINNILDSLSR